MKQYSVEIIEICPSCGGIGKVEKPQTHFADDSYKLISCKNCLGSGRIRVKTTKETRPFVID